MQDRTGLIDDLRSELKHANTIDKLQLKLIIWKVKYRRWGDIALKVATAPLVAIFITAFVRHPIFVGLFTFLVWYYGNMIRRWVQA